jgi:hypothetical protein
MGRLRSTVGLALATLALVTVASSAYADEKCPTPPAAPKVTWGATPSATAPAVDDSPVSKARDLMARAKFLDEVATTEELSAIALAAKLPALRTAARTARDKADKSSTVEKLALEAKAEELETDVTITEAEAAEKKKAAADNRRVARELRARAVKIVKEPVEREDVSSCDPPFRFTLDGRKIYRLECLK